MIHSRYINFLLELFFQSMWLSGKHYKQILQILWNSCKNHIYNSWKRNTLPWKTPHWIFLFERCNYSYLMHTLALAWRRLQDKLPHPLFLRELARRILLTTAHHHQHVGLGGVGNRCPTSDFLHVNYWISE
jgi:hypothetical protein